MLHRRRLNSVQLVLVSILLCSSVYLWSRKIHPFRYDDDGVAVYVKSNGQQRMDANELDSPADVFGSAEELADANPPAVPIADPSQSETVQQQQQQPDRSCDGAQVTTESAEQQQDLEPFAQFNFDLSAETEDNRTLQLLDLWQDDANCTQHQVRLLPDDTVPDPGALVSFPGSGNSWLRMLLMGATGVFIRSVYDGDDSLFQSKANHTYRLPLDCGCTLLQKTHDFTLDAALFYLHVSNRTQVIEQFQHKGVLIIRNPFTAIRSYRNFEYGGMQGKAPEDAFVGRKWDNFVSRSIASWETLAHVWISRLKQGGIIYYERLRHETEKELRRLAGILGLTLDEDRLNCVVRHATDNSFKRTAKSNDDPYTASQRLLIHKAIDSVQEALKKRGLDPLPVERYESYNVMPEYGIV